MYQATTPGYRFILPFDVAEQVDDALITFKQGAVAVDYTLAETTVDGNNIYLRLTQEQTNMFREGVSCKVQMRLKMKDGSVISTRVAVVSVHESLNREIL